MLRYCSALPAYPWVMYGNISYSTSRDDPAYSISAIISKDIFDFLRLHGDGWVLSGAVTVRLNHQHQQVALWYLLHHKHPDTQHMHWKSLKMYIQTNAQRTKSARAAPMSTICIMDSKITVLGKKLLRTFHIITYRIAIKKIYTYIFRLACSWLGCNGWRKWSKNFEIHEPCPAMEL